MPTIGTNTGDGAAEMPRSTETSSRQSGSLLRRLGWSTVALCAAVLVLLGL